MVLKHSKRTSKKRRFSLYSLRRINLTNVLYTIFYRHCRKNDMEITIELSRLRYAEGTLWKTVTRDLLKLV